jgi:hypothetical protein
LLAISHFTREKSEKKKYALHLSSDRPGQSSQLQKMGKVNINKTSLNKNLLHFNPLRALIVWHGEPYANVDVWA